MKIQVFFFFLNNKFFFNFINLDYEVIVSKISATKVSLLININSEKIIKYDYVSLATLSWRWFSLF